MQRRIAAALTLAALASIVLVGLGVLSIYLLGGRGRATQQVTRALNLVSVATEGTERPGADLQRLVAESQRDLGIQQLEPVLVDETDGVYSLDNARGPRVRSGAQAIDLQLDEDQFAALENDETVIVQRSGQVIGLRAIPARFQDLPPDVLIAALAMQPTATVPRESAVWFALSSLVVLLGAALAGARLAARLVRPVRDIQATAAAIADGDLTARAAADGPDELGELGRTVNQMAADLERSQALERQFLMSVSHDLRTPLTAISGYAEALQDDAVDSPASAGEVIGANAARLERLVGDLLDLARLDADRFTLRLQSVDLAVVAGRTAAGLAPEASQHGLTVEPIAEATPIVLADPDRLGQAIGNLITNAISFARERVRVETSLATEGGQRLALLTVADDGPGFASEDLPHVFERLYTSSARPRRAENPSGLGLAIVRELVTAMGGRVTAANNPTGGARITIALPVADER